MKRQTIDFRPLPYPQTRETAQAYFIRHGISKTEWARHFGLPRTVVEHLLGGKLKGRRGTAHAAAVKLGLKPEPGEAV